MKEHPFDDDLAEQLTLVPTHKTVGNTVHEIVPALTGLMMGSRVAPATSSVVVELIGQAGEIQR